MNKYSCALMLRLNKFWSLGKLYYDLIYGLRYRRVSLPSSEESDAILHSTSPDSHTSSICKKNGYTGEVDLQIIVPVYNVEKFVVKCIDSILNQVTKYSYRIIIINDGSPDRSRELLKRYENNDKVVIIDQDNKGFSGARNTGLANLTGKYVMFVDSDDYITEDAVELMMDMAFKTDADIVQGGYYEKQGEHISIGYIPKNKGLCDSSNILGFPWAKVYKSWMWDGIKFPEGYWFEDTINVVLFMNLTEKIATVDRPVYYYYTNPKGISAKAVGCPKTIDSFYVTRSLFNDAQELGLLSQKQKIQKLLDIFCSQTMIAAIRTVRLNLNVQKALFVATSEVYFSKFDTSTIPSSELFKGLVDTFKTKNFAKYLSICLLKKL